jgi:hypothetical protein
VARVLVRVLFVRRKGQEVRAIGAEIGAKFLELASRSHSVIPLQRRIQAEKPRAFRDFAFWSAQAMTLTIAHMQPIVSLLAGILILIMPRLLNYIVAIYLIISGVLGLGLFH